MRVSDWAKDRISTDQVYYSCLDTEVTIGAFRVVMVMELGMRSYESVPEQVSFDHFLEWWGWAVNMRVDLGMLQRVEANTREIVVNPNKKAEVTSNHWLTHVRGRRFAKACNQEVLESREVRAERG